MLSKQMIEVLHKVRPEERNISLMFHDEAVEIKGTLHKCLIISPYLNPNLHITAFAITYDWKCYRATFNKKTKEWLAIKRVDNKKGKNK